MGKNKNHEFTPMSDLIEEKKKLEKKMGRITIPCSHTNEKGKIKVEFLKGNFVRCKRCGAKFDFGAIDIGDLDDAVDLLHNAINQTKALTDDPEREDSIIKTLGNLDYNLKEMSDLYKKTVSSLGKGNNKKKNRDNDFGSYGASSIDFIGGRSNNKRRF